MQVNMLEAKNQLSKLVKAAIAGEEVVIASIGVPIVRLVLVIAKKGLSAWGKLRQFRNQIDAAFAPEVEREIARKFNGKK